MKMADRIMWVLIVAVVVAGLSYWFTLIQSSVSHDHQLDKERYISCVNHGGTWTGYENVCVVPRAS